MYYTHSNNNNFIPLIKLLFGSFIFILFSCQVQEEEKGKLVAQVGTQQLFLEEIDKEVFTNSEDSVSSLKSYIQSWIDEAVILDKSKGFVADDEIQRKVEDYKKDLIIYHFEKQWVDKYIDTVVDDDEIKQYYEQNEKEFVLKDYLVRPFIIVLPHERKDIDKEWIDKRYPLYNKVKDTEDLINFCKKKNLEFYYGDSLWMYFDDLYKYLPLGEVDKDNFVKWIRKTSIIDSSNTYYVNILEFKIKDAVSPLSFEKERIKSILVNIREQELKMKFREDVMNEAVKANKIQIFIE